MSTTIKKSLTTNTQIGLLVKKRLITNTSFTRVKKQLTTNTSMGRNVKKRLITNTRIDTNDTHQHLQQNINPAPPLIPVDVSVLSNTKKSFLAGTQVLIKNTETNITKKIPGEKYIENITAHQKRSGAFEWSVNLRDNDETFALLNSQSEYYHWVDTDVYKSSSTPGYAIDPDPNSPTYNQPIISLPDNTKVLQGFTPIRLWFIQTKIGDSTWTSPALIMLNSSRKSKNEVYPTVFTGTDLTRNFLVENQTLATWRTTKDKRVMATDVLKTIFSTFGIPKYDLSNFDDFVIPKIHFQGEVPIDVINRICAVNFNYWYFRGDVFVIERVNFKTKGYDWFVRDIVNLVELDYNKSSAGLINSVIVCRTQSKGAPEFHEGVSVGLQVVGLNTPRYLPSLRVIDEMYCQVMQNNDYHVDWINAKGQYNVNPPYVKAQFTVKQNILSADSGVVQGTGVYWKVQISGMSSDDMLEGIQYTQNYSVKYQDNVSIRDHGLLAAPQPINNPLIPTQEWGLVHAYRYIQENNRLLETINGARIPILNPWIIPGQTVLFNDMGTSISAQHFFVEEVAHNWRSMETTLNCSKYQNTTEPAPPMPGN